MIFFFSTRSVRGIPQNPLSHPIVIPAYLTLALENLFQKVDGSWPGSPYISAPALSSFSPRSVSVSASFPLSGISRNVR